MAKDDFSQGGVQPESAGQISPNTAIGLARHLEIIGHDLRRLAAPVMADASAVSASFEGALVALSAAVEDVRRLDVASAVKLESETAERQKAEATLRKTLRARTVMAECNHALLHEAGEGELFERMCRIIVEFGHYPAAWIGRVRSDSEQTVVPVAHAGHEDGFLREWRFVLEDPDHDQTPAGLAIRSGHAVRLADLAGETRWEGWRKQVMSRGYGSVLVFPLREQYRVFGVLSIYDWDASAFTDDEASLLQELADDIAYGVTNLRIEAARERAERRLATQFEIARLLADSASLVQVAPA
ncbi:MAG: GAF domain-containing protein, partial [Methylococcaceae bacterium]